MILISHRGNIDGKSEYENNPGYVERTIEKGYNVEIDVWSFDGCLYLGHDKPEHEINLGFLEKNSEVLWCHCKNIDVFMFLLKTNIHCFYHTNEDYVLTSKRYLWVHPRANFFGGICVMPEERQDSSPILSLARGICSDQIGRYV